MQFKQKQAQAAAAKGGETSTPKEKKKKEKAPELPPYVEQTPPGEKKILGSLEDPHRTAYIPAVVESAWGAWWEKEGFFKPEYNTPGYNDGKVNEKGTFVIPIPPPNVTGKLHVGHTLATSLQDLLIRWHRMKGYTTAYIPGCDHAGISTQSVVENMLWRREKKTRHDLGRTEFVNRTYEWKEEYHQSITRVLKRLGGSMDWTREVRDAHTRSSYV